MRVSELWLKDYISLSSSIAAIGEQLTFAGLEVDSLEKSSDENQNILTLKIPPNRGDCLSMEGIVREIALLNQQNFKEMPLALSKPSIPDTLGIKVTSPALCPRYVGRVVLGIRSDLKTPNWIKERLEWAGIRSISLVVDISNYVMLEMGQPLHAFDLGKIEGSIEVRLAKLSETLVLLDERIVRLDPETLIIADEKKPLAIAGIMGGLDSGVKEDTHSIFIESAYFDPISIRLTAKRFGLMTDASYRFERGIDPELPIRAIERMTNLLLECSEVKAGPIVEVKSSTHLPKNPVITLRTKRVSAILGIEISDENLLNLLQRALLTVEKNDTHFLVTAPSFRHDIQLEIDVIEEIARILGYNRIPSTMPVSALRPLDIPERKNSEFRIKQVLVDRGYDEIVSYSFLAPKWQTLMQVSDGIALKNPLSSEMSIMRMSLLPGLLQAVQYNQRRQVIRNRFFEVGNCFFKKDGEKIEKTYLGGVCSGSLFKEQWGLVASPIDFYDIKQDIETILNLTKRHNKFEFKSENHYMLHPGQSAVILENKRAVGLFGALHPKLVKELDLAEPVFVFELDLASFITEIGLPIFQPLSKFPVIRRDLSILVDATIFASTLKSAIVKCAGEWLQDVTLFDVYQGKGIEPGKKSIALSLILQHPTRTLVDTEVQDVVKTVLSMLSREFKATLRE